MNEFAQAPGSRRSALWAKVLAGLAVFCALLVALAVFFPWDWLREPLNHYVSEKTGRHFEITRRLDVKLGRTTRILADGIEFSNPDWAHDPHLVKAEAAEIQVELLPLLRRRIVLPLVQLHKPVLGLQVEADGRRSWALGRDTADPHNLPQIGALIVDDGSMHFIASHHGADIRTDFAIQGSPAPSAPDLPLTFRAKGTWQKEPFSARGRAGNVLYLSAPLQNPFPIEIEASAGRTTGRAKGAIASLATLDGSAAAFDLQGHDLADLYRLVGMVLPSTPRYSLHGHLSKQGEVWHVKQVNGKLGNSDLSGELTFDRGQAVPLLTGTLRSRLLDFDDLAPLVGMPEQPRSAAALPQVPGARATPTDARRASRDPGRKVLPTAGLDLPRLKAMQADVNYEAARIGHPRQLPLERMKLHVRMKDGVLQLDPLNLGVAGGDFKGRLRIDANSSPAVAEVHLDARGLELNKLFPTVKLTQASFGRIHGDIDLKGRGNSVAQMLGTSSGQVAMLMGRGEISNLLLEIAGIDGAEILKFLMGGDRNVVLRCAAAAFDVDRGQMNARALVLDTTDTVIYGTGAVSLSGEALDLTLRPYPKDMSILSLRSPLKATGTFASPRLGPDKGALAGRAGLALALAAVNPLLGLAATIETGPGKDANCGPALREAYSPYAAARVAVMSKPPDAGRTGTLLGGPADRGGPAQPAPARGAVAPSPPTPTAPAKPDRPYGP